MSTCVDRTVSLSKTTDLISYQLNEILSIYDNLSTYHAQSNKIDIMTKSCASPWAQLSYGGIAPVKCDDRTKSKQKFV